MLVSINISKQMAVNSIYSMYLESKHPEEITFHHVLQRVNVLIQDRLAYAIFERLENGRFKMFCPFLNDPIAGERIAKFHSENFGSSSQDSYKSPEKYLFQLLGSKYYLMCIKILPVSGVNSRRFSFADLSVKKGDKKAILKIDNDRGKNDFQLTSRQKNIIIRYILSKIFVDEECNYKISETFPEYKRYVLNSIEILEKRKNKIDAMNNDGEKYHWYQDCCYEEENIKEIEFIEYDESVVEDFNEGFNFKDGALEKSFLKVKESLENISSGSIDDNGGFEKISNFLFFSTRARFKYKNNDDDEYTFEDKRKECYHFGLRLSLPYSQKEELKRYFSSLNLKGKEAFSEQYLLFQEAPFNVSNFIKKEWVEWLDDEFWEVLLSGSEEIISILEQDFGRNLRSVIDPVIYNLFVHYPIIFENGGIDRSLSKINNESTSKKDFIGYLRDEEYYNDCMRIVTFYYLIFGMLQEDHREVFKKNKKNDFLSHTDMALSVVPITVQGVCYGCVAHYASMGDKLRLRSDNWQRNYNLYHNIDIRFRRTLRHQLETLYLKKLSAEVEYIVGCLLFDTNIISSSLKEVNSFIKDHLHTFRGFIPFPVVSLVAQRIQKKLNNDNKYIELYSDDKISYVLKMEIKPQEYFMRFFKRDYIGDEKITETVRLAASRVLGSDYG